MKERKTAKRLLSVWIAAAILWCSMPVDVFAKDYAVIGGEMIDEDAVVSGEEAAEVDEVSEDRDPFWYWHGTSDAEDGECEASVGEEETEELSDKTDSLNAAEGNDLIEKRLRELDGFYQEQDGSCAVNATVSLLRRWLYFEEYNSGKETWRKITNQSIKASGLRTESIPVCDSTGKKHILEINFKPENPDHKYSKELNKCKQDIKALLKKHPEGIVLHIKYDPTCEFKKDCYTQHALVITRCDENYMLYGVDSSDIKWKLAKTMELYNSHLFGSKYGMLANNNEQVWERLSNAVDNPSYIITIGTLEKCWDGKNDIHKIAINECSSNKSPNGNHNWGDLGKCTYCNTEFGYNNNYDSRFTAGVYKCNAKTEVFTKPYENQSFSSNGKKISKGAQVTLSTAVINSLGETWVEISGGYANGKNFTMVKAAEPPKSVSITNGRPTTPSSPHTEGNSFSIGGILTANNCSMTSIHAYFKNTANSSRSGDTGKIPLASLRTLNIKDTKVSAVNTNLKFGSLRPGTYTYVVEVTADGTNYSFESNPFTVVAAGSSTAKVIPKPTISYVGSYIGGQRYSVSGASGYTFKYSTNGGGSYSGENTGTVTFNVNNSTTICAYTTKKSSDVVRLAVTIPTVSTPAIQQSYRSEGTLVSISTGNSADAIYYRTSSSGYTRYTGAFYVTENTVISAYGERSGCKTSAFAQANVSVCKPDVPNISRISAADIAEGDPITVRWNNDPKAGSYTVKVRKNGADWKTDTAYEPYYVVNAEEEGDYEITVCAANKIGTSSFSNSVSTKAHGPVRVRFLDYDGSLIKEEMVKYGRSATRPSTPLRRGYTFAGWIGQYAFVTKDSGVTADYEINVYKIKFYDVDGATFIGEEDIEFDTAIDSKKMEDKVSVENGGRAFTGWDVFYAKEEDTYLDLEHVDSDMSVRAVTTWVNKDLPVYVDNVSATINYGVVSDVMAGFHVRCRLSSIESKDISAKVLVTLLSKASEDGSAAYKMINSKTAVVHIPAESNNTVWEGDIAYDSSVRADRIEISVVSIEGLDRTGGLIAETKYYDIPDDGSLYWSEWMTEEELVHKGHSVDEEGVYRKTQYRDRVNKKNTTTTTSATAPAGYTLQSNNSYWDQDWSGWSDSVYTASATRQIDTQSIWMGSGHNEYRYGRWKNSSGNIFYCPISAVKYKNYSSSGWALDYSSWLTYPVAGTQVGSAGKGNTCDSSVYGCNKSVHHIGCNNSSGTKDYWSWKYTVGGNTYYWEESRWVDTSYVKTQYRYKDYHPSYTYYKWDDGVWSDWTDEVLVDSNLTDKSYEVETRILYRIKVEVPETGSTEPVKHINGSMKDETLEGKNAVILVYKSKNTDPTESQIEYIGSTLLGENGSYDFRFIPKEKATHDTGDFVVALAIEGSDNYINVGLVEYERIQYCVQYVVDEDIYYEDMVDEGTSSVPPENPEKEGYYFVGWSKNTTNIRQNTTAVARFKPKEYCVAFVDYLNETCELASVNYGEALVIPETVATPVHEGYTFEGWRNGETATVKSNMIVEAVWKPETFEVVFKDSHGKVVDTQQVEYGKAAVRPELSVEDNEMFLGWSDENAWWDVTSNMEILPIVVKKAVAATPSSNLDAISEGVDDTLELYSEEGATIYYTLDGSMPDLQNLYLEEEEKGDASADILSESGEQTGEQTDESEDWEEDDILEEEVPGVTYIYKEPLKLTDTTIVLAMAVKEGCENSSVAQFIHFADYSEVPFEYEEPDKEKKDLVHKTVGLDVGRDIELSVNAANLESIIGFELLLTAENLEWCPSVDTEQGEYIFSAGQMLKENGEYVDGNTHIYWIGERPISGSGKLFDIRMTADEAAAEGSYPICLKYFTGTTFNEDSDRVELDGKVNMTVSGAEDNENTELISIALNKAFMGLAKGESAQLEVSYYPANTTESKALTWSSGNEKVAVVTQSGVVTAVGAGQTEITVRTRNNKSAACTVVVTEENMPVSDPCFSIPSGSIVDAGTELTIWCFPEDGVQIYYTTDGTVPSEHSMLFDEKIVIAESTTIKAIAIMGQHKSSIQEARYIVRDTNADWGDIEPSDIPAKESDIPQGIWVAGIEKKGYPFTGAAIAPQIRVYSHKTRLVPGRDCTITCKNNREAGGAEKGKKAPTIIVKGTGNYSGSLSIPFTITGIEVADTNLVTDLFAANIAYKPELKTLSGKILKAGKDYSIVSYFGANGTMLKKQPQSAGTYSVMITGKGSVKGTEEFCFRISESQKPIEKAKARVSNMVYGGESPKVEVVFGETLLTETEDYIAYLSGTEAKGTATVDIVGIGSYTGAIHKTFKVLPASVEDAAIEMAKEVEYEKGGAKPKPRVWLDTLLREGIDYTVSYSKNNKLGAATVIVKGKGNYKGTAKKTFEIKPKSLDTAGMLIDVCDAQTGKAPTVLIYDTNGKKLAQKKDYSLEIRERSVRITGGTNGLYTGEVEIEGYKKLEKERFISSVKLKSGYAGSCYTGREVRLDKRNIEVKVGYMTLEPDDFEIVGYINNVDKGTATAVIRVTKEGYGGTKLLNFKISQYKID